MSLSNMLPTVWPVVTDGWRRGWNWCRSHGQSLAIAFSCGLALWLALIVYQSSFHKELVILAGPAGSSSWRSADRIASELRNTPRIPGVNYVVRVEATNGLEEIAGRITSDRQGEVIGFSQNRLNPPDRMSMLLPLDYDYLHILCRARFLIESAPGLDVKNFGALLPSIEPGKVFAGPPGSGTRVLAERILARYGRDEAELQELLHPAIDDWLEARAALKSGRVDLVFYSGPIGATTIEDIAVKDKSAVLIGLEDIQSALMRHENYSYRPVKFPLNAYSAEPWDFAPGGFAAQVKLQFCPAELKTIAARRLLVCSSDMPPDDAFLIAKAAQSALASDGNIIGDWKAAPPDVLAVAPPEDSLGVTAHPGAIFVRDKAEPSRWWKPETWSPFWISTLSTIGMFLFTQFLTSVQAQKAAAETAAPALAGAFVDLRSRIESSLGELEQHAGAMSDAEYQTWQERVSAFQKEIGEASKSAAIDAEHQEQLKVAVRNLRMELQLLKPERVVAAESPASGARPGRAGRTPPS